MQALIDKDIPKETSKLAISFCLGIVAHQCRVSSADFCILTSMELYCPHAEKIQKSLTRLLVPKLQLTKPFPNIPSADVHRRILPIKSTTL